MKSVFQILTLIAVFFTGIGVGCLMPPENSPPRDYVSLCGDPHPNGGLNGLSTRLGDPYPEPSGLEIEDVHGQSVK